MKEKYDKIRILALDVDGVLTDGKIYFGPEGEIFKAFSARDGLGINLWKTAGFKVYIVTGRNSQIVNRRAQELNLDGVFQGVSDKGEVIGMIASQNHCTPEEIAYIGDDLNDLFALSICGLGFVPADGAIDAVSAASVHLSKKGGDGVVREAIEKILENKGILEESKKRFLESLKGRKS